MAIIVLLKDSAVSKTKISIRPYPESKATKSTRRMPWRKVPKKDVVGCDKPRGAVSRRYIRGFPNGVTHSRLFSRTFVLNS